MEVCVWGGGFVEVCVCVGRWVEVWVGRWVSGLVECVWHVHTCVCVRGYVCPCGVRVCTFIKGCILQLMTLP